MGFVHLHLRSSLSGESLIRPGALPAAAQRLGMAAVALTDRYSLAGVSRFDSACREAGVKAVIGAELEFGPGTLVLLAANETGYGNLCKLTARRSAPDADGLARHSAGLIALGDRLDPAHATVCREAFGARSFFVELRAGARDGLALAEELGCGTVATADCRYLDPAHALAFRALHDEGSAGAGEAAPQLHLRSPTEMSLAFADVPQALRTTEDIAERCSLEPRRVRLRGPLSAEELGEDAPARLADLARAGLAAKLARAASRGAPARDEAAYRARLEMELDLIRRMEHTGSFLAVHEYFTWARQRGIALGPGGGPSPGSLVVWALGLSEADPVAHGLVFERFLNPERVSLPSVDVEIDDGRVGEVLEHLVQVYGRERVARTAHYERLDARDALEAACDGLDVPDAVAAGLQETLGKGVSLKSALREGGCLHDAHAQPKATGATVDGRELTTRDVLDAAAVLDGLVRGPGVDHDPHGRFFVLGASPVAAELPVWDAGDGTLVTQVGVDDVDGGVPTFYLHAERAVATVQRALAAAGQPCAPEEIPLDDPAAFALLREGDGAGIFMMDVAPFRRLVRRIAPECLGDLAAAFALARPGPLESRLPSSGATLADTFVAARRGRRPTLPHPSLDGILADTYGVLVFQEQVIRIAHEVAGFRLGQADMLLRALSRSKPPMTERAWNEFREACDERGVSQPVAREVFAVLEEGARLTFGKAHAVGRAMLILETAWLKAHHPEAFSRLAGQLELPLGARDRAPAAPRPPV